MPGPALVQALTVFHNVYMGGCTNVGLAHLRNLLPAAADVQEVREVLEPLRLEEKMFANVGQLSGGQYRALARALYHPGRVIVADEPVSSTTNTGARDPAIW